MKDACRSHQLALLDARASTASSTTGTHDPSCDDCNSFALAHARLAPPVDLSARTFDALAPLLRRRRALRRKMMIRLSLASAASLPVVLAVNATLVWASYGLTSRLLTPEIGTLVATVVGGALLLSLSLAYGSLPLLASWGLQLRERTA